MSNFHLSVKPIKRSKGRNIVNKAAYNSRSKLIDLNTGKSYNYRSRGETIHSSFLIPDDSPPWLKSKSQDRGAFWSYVEKLEKRKDAQVGREIVLSIGASLSPIASRYAVFSFIHFWNNFCVRLRKHLNWAFRALALHCQELSHA